MQPEQYILLDFVDAQSKELEHEPKLHKAVIQKQLENPTARHYGALVRQPEIIETVRHPVKLATDSGSYRLG